MSFKEGDRVLDDSYGAGTVIRMREDVIRITEGQYYPVLVYLDIGHYEIYTNKGVRQGTEYVSLYHIYCIAKHSRTVMENFIKDLEKYIKAHEEGKKVVYLEGEDWKSAASMLDAFNQLLDIYNSQDSRLICFEDVVSMGDPIFVRNHDDLFAVIRIFSHFSDNGNAVCFKENSKELHEHDNYNPLSGYKYT